MDQETTGMASEKAFEEFEGIVNQLYKLSDDLAAITDKQIDAVVSSEQEQIEAYVEQYTNLRGVFKEQEHMFVDHLQLLLQDAGSGSAEIKLENLKEAYPASENKITEWQESLEERMGKLKAKHEKLNRLLEFAVEQNMKLMHSIYSLSNKKNTRYSSGGTKEEISSGIALNKEA